MSRFPPRFESQPRLTFWGRRSPWWLTGLGLGVLCGLLTQLIHLLGAVWQGHQTTQELNRQSHHLRSPARPLPKPAQPKPAGSTPDGNMKRGLSATAPPELSQDQRRQLNRVILQLNTPWQDLFQQLERSTPPDVALISIEPDAYRASVKLQAEAKSLDTLLSYAASLASRDVLGALTYSKHETNDQDPNKPIRLSFEMALRTPARLTASHGAAQPAAVREALVPSAVKP